MRKIYERLYKSRDVEDCDINELISEIPELSEEQQASLEGEITLEETGTALKNMKNGKIPGTDGFGADFFKCFWRHIGDFVVRVLNESFRDGELSATQKQGIITASPKEIRTKIL